MKTVTTKHPIGYTENVAVIATALREQFGFDDQSHLLTAVAAHIWSVICGTCSESKTWGQNEVTDALDRVARRLETMRTQLGKAVAFHDRSSV